MPPNTRVRKTGRFAHRWQDGKWTTLWESFSSFNNEPCNRHAVRPATALVAFTTEGGELGPDAGQLCLETAQTLFNRG